MAKKIITGPQRKFCEAYALEENGESAYHRAYPGRSKTVARSGASRLLTNAYIQEEIARIRARAEEKAGSAVLTLAEVHSFLARLLRSRVGLLDADSDLWNSIKRTKDGIEYRLSDKLAAITRWCDLKGEGSEARQNDQIAELIARCRQ